jgi:hypothetical protein
MAANPSRFGLAAYESRHPTEGIYHAADELFPLASTRKVLILGAYAQASAAGVLPAESRIPLTEIDRWYWPGTDGGAHKNALADWAARSRIANDSVTLDDLAWAMIRWSDNAAADLMLQKIGGPSAALAFARSMSMTAQDPVGSILGEYIAWVTIGADDWVSLPPLDRAERSYQLGNAQERSAFERLRFRTEETQRKLATVSPRGTPREWATLMARLASGDGLSEAAQAICQRAFEWPMVAFPNNRSRFDRFGAKGGSLAGVLTDVTYRKVIGQEGIFVEALFFRDLPKDVERQLRSAYTQQALAARMAEDPEFRARARSLLSGP